MLLAFDEEGICLLADSWSRRGVMNMIETFNNSAFISHYWFRYRKAGGGSLYLSINLREGMRIIITGYKRNNGLD